MSQSNPDKRSFVSSISAALASLKQPFNDETSALGAHELDRVMHELGMTCADLNPENPDSFELLPAMLARLGLGSRSDIEPAVLRELERPCSRCTKGGTCRTALREAGTPDYEAFCNNAPTLATLEPGSHG